MSHFRLTLSNTDRPIRRNKRGFYFDFFLKPTRRLLTHSQLCLLTAGSLKYGRPVPVTRNRSRSSSLPKLIRKREENEETISLPERIFDEYRDASLIIFRAICRSVYLIFQIDISTVCLEVERTLGENKDETASGGASRTPMKVESHESGLISQLPIAKNKDLPFRKRKRSFLTICLHRCSVYTGRSNDTFCPVIKMSSDGKHAFILRRYIR